MLVRHDLRMDRSPILVVARELLVHWSTEYDRFPCSNNPPASSHVHSSVLGLLCHVASSLDPPLDMVVDGMHQQFLAGSYLEGAAETASVRPAATPPSTWIYTHHCSSLGAACDLGQVFCHSRALACSHNLAQVQQAVQVPYVGVEGKLVDLGTVQDPAVAVELRSYHSYHSTYIASAVRLSGRMMAGIVSVVAVAWACLVRIARSCSAAVAVPSCIGSRWSWFGTGQEEARHQRCSGKQHLAGDSAVAGYMADSESHSTCPGSYSLPCSVKR
jgi:hypothetical protein